jgi:hypothetical protein
MSNWYFDEPWFGENPEYNRRAVYTEDMIVREHAPLFLRLTAPLASTREQIIEDWCVVNWASRTDMPAGEYISKPRFIQHYITIEE